MIDCLIPARGGSKGIPKKNIIKIHDLPLIAYSIYIAKKTPLVKRVFVSTDCPEIAHIAQSFGAFVPFLRPKELASDMSTDREVFKHFLMKANSLDINLSSTLLHLRPTTPSREIEVINEAISLFEKSNNTSLRSAHSTHAMPYKWFKKINDQFYPLIEDDEKKELHNMPRQLLPKAFVPNGYVDLVRSSVFMDENRFHGSRIMAFETDPVIDIDSMEDLKNAQNEKVLIELSKRIKE